MRDLKYLLAYIMPLSGLAALYFGGIWSFATLIIAFGILPIFEFALPRSVVNHSPEAEDFRSKIAFFDLLLYSNLPILFALILGYFYVLSTQTLATYELVGMTLSIGVLCGTMGINVAHELGHRVNKFEQWIAQALLLPEMYMHFFIEHNRGHHKNVATDVDPASSRYGEVIYAFFARSIVYSYLDAWRLENQRLRKIGKSVFSLENQMLRFQFIQLGYLLTVGLVFGWTVIPFALAIALIGVLNLEAVNYIEHYGLRRELLPSGRYEKVSPHHSWNSNHEMGRIFLYELTRHSDHHFKATRKFQILRHFDESPQLPLGYPGSMLLALVPPLWFAVMNKEVKKYNAQLV
ncbi:MAG: alkane 1-monooxygenase [Saprospiraceae bacterium]